MKNLLWLLLALPLSAQPGADHGDHDEDPYVERQEEMRGPRGGGGPGMMRRGRMDEEMRQSMERMSELHRELRAASREGDRKKLEKLVGELFDVKLKTSQKHLENLKKDAAQLEKKISEAKSRRAELIKKRVDKLLGEDEEFDW